MYNRNTTLFFVLTLPLFYYMDVFDFKTSFKDIVKFIDT